MGWAIASSSEKVLPNNQSNDSCLLNDTHGSRIGITPNQGDGANNSMR